MIERIISLLAPHRCIDCGSEGSLLCSVCGSRLISAPWYCLLCGVRCVCPPATAQKVYCATRYADTAKELIHWLKFGRAKAAADDMARIMAERLPFFDASTTVAHIPTAPGRIRRRGYDQAELLARQLAVRLDLPSTSLLRRCNSNRQTGKSRASRLEQARTLFEVRTINMPNNVLLVDDVFTTGATLRAAAGVLHAAGVQRVVAIVFAATERFG